MQRFLKMFSVMKFNGFVLRVSIYIFIAIRYYRSFFEIASYILCTRLTVQTYKYTGYKTRYQEKDL